MKRRTYNSNNGSSTAEERCGLWAICYIAFATTLAFGGDASNIVYDADGLRPHLLHCLEAGKWKNFQHYRVSEAFVLRKEQMPSSYFAHAELHTRKIQRWLNATFVTGIINDARRYQTWFLDARRYQTWFLEVKPNNGHVDIAKVQKSKKRCILRFYRFVTIFQGINFHEHQFWRKRVRQPQTIR